MDSQRLFVDGMNVIGSRPDGWWRDRDGAVRRLAGQLQRLTADGVAVTLVLDGNPVAGQPESPHGGVVVAYGGLGPDAADDRIVELLGASSPPRAGARVVVVTADRALRARVEDLGATVLGPSWLRRRIEALPAAPAGEPAAGME